MQDVVMRDNELTQVKTADQGRSGNGPAARW